MEKGVKSRKEIDEKYKWDLSSFFENTEEFLKAYEKVEQLIKEVVKFKGHIMESSDSLYNFYKTYEKMDRLADKVIIYAFLVCDTDTTESSNQKLKAKADKLMNNIQSELSFVNPEMLEVDYDYVLNITKDSKFDEYRHDLENMFRFKEHTLSKEEESIIAKASNVLNVPDDIFYNLDNSDIKLGKIKTEDGSMVELTNSNYIKYLSSKNREVRKDAFNHMYEYFKGLKNSLASCLKGQVKGNFFISDLKKYNSPLEASLYSDNISINVYKNLIDCVHNNLDALYKYMELRKRALKLDEQHMYDIFVNLTGEEEINIPFDEGKKIVIEALKPLGDTYIKDLNKAFSERWIDIYPNIGKKSGAYSWGCYDSNPYVLLNYENNLDSVSTLAHELGHSMHSFYSKKQTFINHSYPIFLAEIASTVNEILLNNYLYINAKTKEEKITYLTEFLDKVRTTLYRQTMFAEFEMLIHDKEKSNVPLTEEELSTTYYELNKLYYGDSVISDDYIRYEWSRIPHFYSSFYVYKYATGISIAIALASDILNGNQKTLDSYLELLSSGGKDYPLEILKSVGIDLEDDAIYKKAIDMFNEKLNDLESLI